MHPFRNLLTFYGYFMQEDKWKFVALSFMPMIWCCAETFAPYLIKILLDRISVEGLIKGASVDNPYTYFLLIMVITYIALIAAVEIPKGWSLP
jgi:ABC-type multidrug transport system fused ATPase/permease subunit